jgi:hypothetical protein
MISQHRLRVCAVVFIPPNLLMKLKSNLKLSSIINNSEVNMLNKIILVLFLFASTIFAGEVTKNYDFKDFQSVSVGYGMKVDISQSNSYSIEVKADEEDFNYLKVEKEGNELKFYFDKKTIVNKMK